MATIQWIMDIVHPPEVESNCSLIIHSHKIKLFLESQVFLIKRKDTTNLNCYYGADALDKYSTTASTTCGSDQLGSTDSYDVYKFSCSKLYLNPVALRSW